MTDLELSGAMPGLARTCLEQSQQIENNHNYISCFKMHLI